MTHSSKSLMTRVVRAGLAGIGVLAASLGTATGCLDRPVVPASPSTTNVVVTQIRQTGVDKIDLLFMIDNSSSMADKQDILKLAVPKLVSRLVDPICVDSVTELPTTVTTSGGCPAGSAPEFPPINNIHIGVVSSSLGGHGGDICTPKQNGYKPDAEDNAHLIGVARPGLKVDDPAGFLFWGPQLPGGEKDAAALSAAFSDHVKATSENGCGYEASLEAWYRFLIDPAPFQHVSSDGANTVPDRDGSGAPIVDQIVLDQRRAFLRSDSLVAIIMLSDENDCSIVDYGPSWLVGRAGGLPRATTACQGNPNDPCCRSCASFEQSGPPSGCTALTSDAECGKGAYTTAEDSANLRCYDQKKRFGIDFLHPTMRYVAGLKDAQICPNSRFGDNDCNCRAAKLNGLSDADCKKAAGPPAANPLFADLSGAGAPPRDPALVFLAGIVGVPWQDIATEDTLPAGAGLSYIPAKSSDSTKPITLSTPDPAHGGVNRWDVILGDLPSRKLPADPFMIEQPFTRVFTPAATNPITGDTPTPFGTTNPINGSEYDIPQLDDLQYACVFPLAAAKDCSANNNCDCGAGVQKPLCDPANAVSQVKAKGYPGTRFLQVLKDFGDNAIVSSICPKDATGDPNGPSFGYTPAVAAIIARLKEQLNVKCLPRKLSRDKDTGDVACKFVEASNGQNGCSCNAAEIRKDPDPNVAKAVRDQLKKTGQCGGPSQPACDSMCLCEYFSASPDAAGNQLNPNDVAACVNGAASVSTPVWCYIDDPNSPLVAKCPDANQKQLLRLLGATVNGVDVKLPANGAILTIACLGATLGNDAGATGDGG